ncbi:MAG TPA: short-chain dehydrogenase/reductase [Steroidobacteraceae bacterium]|nr:short-chain dehydrogenase/reductase [Steroidobacteraceae bacterium]
MDFGVSGKTALITGASQGIGLAIAQSLAREGCNLLLVSRGREGLERAKELIQGQAKVQVEILAQDLSSTAAVSAVGEAAGHVDFLVNNAGSIPQGDLLTIDDERWRAAWDLKVFGFINLTREIYRAMRERRAGVILNIIGSSGERPSPNYIAGTSGNAALMQFTRALGGESVDHSIRVVGINPGQIETPRQTDRWEAKAEALFGDKARWRELEEIRNSPFGRLARPEEVADVAAFLLSARASYVSGTIVTVDGGRMGRLKPF